MRATPKGLVVAFALVVIILLSVPPGIGGALSMGSGGKIDVFTQKEPYCGKGSNVSSDAFALGELVQVFALVTYNGYPAQGIPATFEAVGPDSPDGRIVFFRSGFTDENGMVMMDFRLPYVNVSTFGWWTIYGNAQIGESILTDMVSFRVGWIVEIVTIRTVDEHHRYQGNFTPNSFVGTELVLRSIAFVEKRVTLTIMIRDEHGTCIDSTEVDDFAVPPNGVLVCSRSSLFIPESTFLGDAHAYASAYTAPPAFGGMPYCPEVSTSFLIISGDVAILSVQPSSRLAYDGAAVDVDVDVRNEGWRTASFNVRAYCNNTLIGTIPVLELAPFSDISLQFVWNTSGVQDGFYLLSAVADIVPGETDLSDNAFVDGLVEVRSKPVLPSTFHDNAVLSVRPSSLLAYVDDVIEIHVIIKNNGNYTESFNVTAFYGSSVIAVQLVEGLGSGLQMVVVFDWDTKGVVAGNYTISARASNVAGEKNLDNNLYVDGLVQVKARTPATSVHDVAVTSVVPLSRFVYIVDYLDVNVTIWNKGTEAESFDVVLYYDERSVAGVLHVEGLVPGAERTMVFHWQTSGVSAGNHTLSANAEPVQGETLVGDNTFVDGEVRFGVAPGGLFMPDWLYWLLLLLLLLLLMLLLLLWYYRKRKESKSSFYAGWTAWYYGYDPRVKSCKTQAVTDFLAEKR